MAYLFVLFFCIFLIFDSIYIYYFLDSRIWLNKSGSKISFISEIKKVKNKKDKIIHKEILIRISINIFFILAVIIINKILFSKFFKLNFIPIRFFGKQTDIRSLFNNNFQTIVNIYYISFYIFLFVMVIYFNKYFVKKIIKEAIYKKTKIRECKEQNNINKICLGINEKGDEIYINQDSLYQNLCITGSIGSGKTSGAILNIVSQLIKNNIGGVILDIKGNLAQKISEICKKENKEENLKIISINSTFTFNLIPEDMTSLEAANILKQIILLLSVNNNTDPYWMDKAENVIQNLFIIIDYYNKKKDLMELHRLVTSNEYLIEKIELCKEELLKGNRYR